MTRIIANIRMELLSDVIFSSGNSIPGGADITLRTDTHGHPYVPGSTIKGLLRETLGNYLCWTGTGTQEDLDALMGTAGITPFESERRLVFSDLRPEDTELLAEDCSYLRTFTKLQGGVAAHGSLHTALCMVKGQVLTGRIICAKEDSVLVEMGLKLIQSVGLKRSRGFGMVSISMKEEDTIRPYNCISAGNWIHYRLRLHTALAITQGTSSPTDTDRKNYSDGKDHIPGAAIRGLIMSRLSTDAPEWFEQHKYALLQDVLFRNAFPLSENKTQIPTPLGFYEDRQKMRFYHVLNQEVVPGDKRARLGRYCYFRHNQLIHSSPSMESSLRITLMDPDTRLPLDGQKRQMFTTEAISPGTSLEGWIYTPDPMLAPKIAEAFQNWLCLGADRFCSSGLCSVECLDGDAPDNHNFNYQEGNQLCDTVYMLLLSPTALMRDGEVCGLSDEDVASLLGVSEAKIQRYATSIIQHSGFNRKWGCALPTVNMYAPGSIFRIQCSEAPSLDRIQELELKGIGIRRNEGCGQVLFLQDFPQITSHVKHEHLAANRNQVTDSAFKLRRQRCRWLMDHSILGNLSDAQCGSLQGYCRNVLYGRMDLQDLYSILDNKINQATQENADYRIAKDQLHRIITTPLYETLSCEPFADTWQDRLQLYIDLFDMNRKGAK